MEPLSPHPFLYSKCYHVGFTILLRVIYYNFLFLFPSAKLWASVRSEHSYIVSIFKRYARLPSICNPSSSLQRSVFSSSSVRPIVPNALRYVRLIQCKPPWWDYKLPTFTIQIGLIQSLPKVQHPVSVIQFVAITCWQSHCQFGSLEHVNTTKCLFYVVVCHNPLFVHRLSSILAHHQGIFFYKGNRWFTLSIPVLFVACAIYKI